jgi:hypothetical protein
MLTVLILMIGLRGYIFLRLFFGLGLRFIFLADVLYQCGRLVGMNKPGRIAVLAARDVLITT